MPLRIGLIGSGFIGRSHSIALSAVGSVFPEIEAPVLEVIAEADPEKAARAARELGFRRCARDWRELVRDPAVDIVDVCSPNYLHHEMALAALAAGKHVYCEKPLEISVERCQQMIDACKAADRMLGTAYRCRFEPHHIECIRIAREQELGAVRIIEAGYGTDVGKPDQWRLKRALSGGGALMDVGVYALQATRYLTGEEPVLVSATETKTDAVKFEEVDETVAWTAKFPGGAVAYCTASFKVRGIRNFRANADG
ncbi:MAG: Gfo/Idh/MocA family protein, partial [Steroidobacteraceae bacterium]